MLVLKTKAIYENKSCFSQKSLGHFYLNYACKNVGQMMKSIDIMLVPWPKWLLCSYMVNTFSTNLLTRTIGLTSMKLGMYYQVLSIICCSNYDPGLNLAYYSTRSYFAT